MKPTTTFQSTKFKSSHQTTIAQLNKVSIRQQKHTYNPCIPFRIKLPQYFNIPAFQDKQLNFDNERQNKVTIINKQDVIFKKRMKDLNILAEGMKRAKNIKQESRYYFTQGVLLHNIEHYMKSIQYFQKFLKIVIYLQDSKSIQLALNVIGSAYVYLGEYQKAIEFHKRQGQVSQRADKFISLANIGLCNQLSRKNKQSQQYYQQAQQILDLSDKSQQNQIRSQVLYQILTRIHLKNKFESPFMTQNITNKSPSKSIQNSILKQQSSIMLKKTTSRKQYQQNKFKYAIHAAQQNIQQHVKSRTIKFSTP